MVLQIKITQGNGNVAAKGSRDVDPHVAESIFRMTLDDVKEKPHDNASHRHKRNVANPADCQIMGVVDPIVLRQQQRSNSRRQQGVHAKACLRKESVVSKTDDFKEKNVEKRHCNRTDKVSDSDSSSDPFIHGDHLGIDSGEEMEGISSSQEEAHGSEVGVLLGSTSQPHGVSDK